MNTYTIHGDPRFIEDKVTRGLFIKQVPDCQYLPISPLFPFGEMQGYGAGKPLVQCKKNAMSSALVLANSAPTHLPESAHMPQNAKSPSLGQA